MPERVVNEIVDLCTLMILCIALHRKRFFFLYINEKKMITHSKFNSTEHEE